MYFYCYEILIFSSPTDYGQTYYLISTYLYKFWCFYNCTLIYSIIREIGNMVWLHISNTFWYVFCVMRRICLFHLRDERFVNACWPVWSTLELHCPSVEFSSRWFVHQWKWDAVLTSCHCCESHHLDLIMAVFHKHLSIWYAVSTTAVSYCWVNGFTITQWVSFYNTVLALLKA